jgi:hypothetical protein
MLPVSLSAEMPAINHWLASGEELIERKRPTKNDPKFSSPEKVGWRSNKLFTARLATPFILRD